MPYIVSNGRWYVKRTCTRYGPYYGSLVLTEHREDARVCERLTYIHQQMRNKA